MDERELQEISEAYTKTQNRQLRQILMATISSAMWLGYDGYKRFDKSIVIYYENGKFNLKYDESGVGADDCTIECANSNDTLEAAFDLLKY